MQYQDIEAPIAAEPTGEAFKVAYVAVPREHRRWLTGWDEGPRWSEERSDAIWVASDVAWAFREHFGNYRDEDGKIRLFDRPTGRLKEIVGRDYWNHIT